MGCTAVAYVLQRAGAQKRTQRAYVIHTGSQSRSGQSAPTNTAATVSVAASQGPASTEIMRPDNLFSQSRFADEVSDWLQNRATSTEAERFQRYVGSLGCYTVCAGNLCC